MKTTNIRQVLKNWNIVLREVHDADITGSPERTKFRTVIEDSDENFYVLEEITLDQIPRKKEIIDLLNKLNKNGIKKILPYIPDQNNDYIVEHDGMFFELREFIEGKKIQRPEYTKDIWRAEKMSKFLHDLNKQDIKTGVFSLPEYISELLLKIQNHNPEIFEKTKLTVTKLEQFFEIYDNLPVSLCHGDFHPLNMIWGENDIKAIIDWEFFGSKPELYDIALLIGSIGMDDPKALNGLFVKKLIEQTKPIYKRWDYLIDIVIAIRFAWLSEWLRYKEQNFVELELDYMDFLFDKKSELMKEWGISLQMF